MPKRGVIYVYWGEKVKKELARSVESLIRHHPDIPYKLFQLPEGSTLLDKSKMLAMSPYDTTLFLDTDTVVMDNLDFGFEMAEKHGLCCCINECPWARRYADIGGDQVEYNTGVLFFTKQATPVFEKWAACASEMDSSIVFVRQGKKLIMPHNDQAGFSEAIAQSGFNPYVLPMNWNLRPQWHTTFFGPIKIWHDRSDVPAEVKFWNEDQAHPASIIKYSADKPS